MINEYLFCPHMIMNTFSVRTFPGGAIRMAEEQSFRLLFRVFAHVILDQYLKTFAAYVLVPDAYGAFEYY